jgi:hypothetical protein
VYKEFDERAASSSFFLIGLQKYDVIECGPAGFRRAASKVLDHLKSVLNRHIDILLDTEKWCHEQHREYEEDDLAGRDLGQLLADDRLLMVAEQLFHLCRLNCLIDLVCGCHFLKLVLDLTNVLPVFS